MDKFSVLQQYFGHSSFRPGQEQVVDAIVSGQDVLGVMPTGAGKSVCYQVPAMLMPGLTLVISPLISLMQDQVAALEEEGVHAACLNSALPEGLYSTILRAALEGDYKILYVAPERLLTDSFLYLAMHARIAFVAVDEAHCVSQWGQDFRPSYLKIAEFISRLPCRPVIGAFTATATEQVKQDIIALLQLNQPFTLTTGFDRPNLYFGVARPRDKERYIEEYILDHRDRSGIVYCATRKSVESVCKELRSVGISATRYHAGLTPEERSKNQEDFVYDRKRVMVATNAFGMGIDKSNVSFVLHYNMPKNLENYYQEAGRAGRDGERAECILLFSLGDVQTAKYFIQNSHDNDELTPEQAEAAARRDRERLDVMVGVLQNHPLPAQLSAGLFRRAPHRRLRQLFQLHRRVCADRHHHRSTEDPFRRGAHPKALARRAGGCGAGADAARRQGSENPGARAGPVPDLWHHAGCAAPAHAPLPGCIAGAGLPGRNRR